jgi:hypothetical protein
MNYKRFDKSELTNRENWHKLALMNEKEIKEIYDAWVKIDLENKEIAKENSRLKSEALTEIKSVLSKHKISTEKFSKSHIFKSLGYHSWFEKNIWDVINKQYPYYYNSGTPRLGNYSITKDDITLSLNSSYDFLEGCKKLAHQYKMQVGKKVSSSKLLTESIKYAITNNIDIEGYEPKDIIAVVDEYARDKWVEDNYNDGDEIYLKHGCDECSTWFYGSHRCSCGNRRVSLSVDGNLLDGYYGYPECN